MWSGRLSAGLPALLLAAASVVGCGAEAEPAERPVRAVQDSVPFRILPDPAFGALNVPVTRPAGITVKGGQLESVTLSTADGEKVDGELAEDRERWLISEPLEFGTRYRWRGSATDAAGKEYPISGSFSTVEPEEQVTVSSNVVDGGVYPEDLQITLTFSVPVEDQAAVERALTVGTEPWTAGAWEWSEDARVVTWAVKQWKPGATVQLSGKFYGVRIGDGDYGADDIDYDLRIVGG